jgi:hypothetical protein
MRRFVKVTEIESGKERFVNADRVICFRDLESGGVSISIDDGDEGWSFAISESLEHMITLLQR